METPGFEGFEQFDVPTTDAVVHGVRGGSGPPLLLLHGIPQSHAMWTPVLPALADRFTVIATDLRGFGASGAPDPATVGYSMADLARDQFEVMSSLGHESFAVVGHDRGARCAYRMAVQRPDRINRLAVLDIIPTGDAYERADAQFATGFWVWSFLAAPSPVPEELVTAAPAAFVDAMLDGWSDSTFDFPAADRARYTATFADLDRVAAICAQYRAAATADVADDRRDRSPDAIRCPVLALWSEAGPIGQWYDALQIWHGWARTVDGAGLPGGHFLVEEQPDAVLARLVPFLAADPPPPMAIGVESRPTGPR